MLTLDVNLKVEAGKNFSRATTQYTNFNFNSMVKFGDVFLVANSTGLFTIGADDDDGTLIDAYFEPVTTDFGIDNSKKVRFLYMGYEANYGLRVTVTADQNISAAYDVPSSKDGQQRTRVPVGNNIAGSWLNIKVSNVNGCDFSIDYIRAMLSVRSSGVHGSLG